MEGTTIDNLPQHPVSCSRIPYVCECAGSYIPLRASLPGIPAEIRLEIWNHLLGWPEMKIGNDKGDGDEKIRTSFSLNLFIISKETRSEILSVLNKRLQLEVHTYHTLDILNILPETWLGMVQRVNIVLTPPTGKNWDWTTKTDIFDIELVDILPSLKSIFFKMGCWTSGYLVEGPQTYQQLEAKDDFEITYEALMMVNSFVDPDKLFETVIAQRDEILDGRYISFNIDVNLYIVDDEGPVDVMKVQCSLEHQYSDWVVKRKLAV